MSSPVASAGPPTAVPPAKDRRLRRWAIPILILLLAEILVGNQLAVVGSPYPTSYLAAHIAVAALLVVVTGVALAISVRLPSWPARLLATVTFLGALGATAGGTLFLYAGGAQSDLDIMEGLGVIALLTDILLIVWGAVTLPSSTARPAR